MERMYREITLRKKRSCERLLLGGLVLGALCLLFYGISGRLWEQLLLAGTNCIQPALIRFQDTETSQEEAPFYVQLLLPELFSFTWKEAAETFSIIEVTRKELPEDEATVLCISMEDTLALMQENLYVSEHESVPEPMPIQADKVVQEMEFSQYSEISELIKAFYVVDASTSADAGLLNIQELTSFDCTIDKEAEGPQILIYHSHSQEGFADSVPGDENTTIVGAGKKLAALLEGYGFQVLHHTGTYDYPSRDEAYSNALPAMEQVLSDNPTIQVVIDLHRDAVEEGTKLVKTIDGKDYARFMFFNGICRGVNGPITYLNNPYLKENLAFSFQSQVIAETYFPGITRKIYLKAWRYNMHFKPRNMLIELGAQTNTVEEIMNTTEILAFIINEVLSGQ